MWAATTTETYQSRGELIITTTERSWYRPQIHTHSSIQQENHTFQSSQVAFFTTGQNTPTLPGQTVTFSNSTSFMNTTSSSINSDLERDKIRRASFYFRSCIIFPGIILNTLALLVLAVSRMRKTTASKYMLALSIFDNIVLIGELLTWLTEVEHEEYTPILGPDFIHKSDIACQFIYFLRYCGRFLSAWTTVIISCERFIVVRFPLRAKIIFTKKNAYISIITETVIGFALTAFPFYTMGVRSLGYCGILNPQLYEIFLWVTLIAGDLILPSLIVCVATGFVIVTLIHARATRKHQIQSQHIHSRREFQLTITLTVIAVAFVILRLPYCIAFPLHMHRDHIFTVPLNPFQDYVLWATRDITGAIAIVNYMINFFLYALCASTFRKEFKRLFCCRRNKIPNRQTTTSTVVSRVNSLVPPQNRNYLNGSNTCVNQHNIITRM